MKGRLLATVVMVSAMQLWVARGAAAEPDCRVVATRTEAKLVSLNGEETLVYGDVVAERVCFSSTAEEAAYAKGGGDGGEVQCDAEPYGPLAEIERIWAAVNAGNATPGVSQPLTTADVVFDPGQPGPAAIVETDWYRVEGNTAQVKYRVKCPDAEYAVPGGSASPPTRSGAPSCRCRRPMCCRRWRRRCCATCRRRRCVSFRLTRSPKAGRT